MKQDKYTKYVKLLVFQICLLKKKCVLHRAPDATLSFNTEN
jgi:hypothetical protein